MMDIFYTDSVYAEFIAVKDVIDKQLTYRNKLVDTKWMNIFGKLEAKSHKSKTLQLPVSKIYYPIQYAFVEGIFSLMSSHKADTRN